MSKELDLAMHFSKASMMPLPAIAFFPKFPMHKREIEPAHSSPPFSCSYDADLHGFHVHSMNTYFFWLHLAFP